MIHQLFCNDEEEGEQYDFDELSEEQMDIHYNRSEKSSGKKDNYITSNSLMDYENELTKRNMSTLSIQVGNQLGIHCKKGPIQGR